MRPFWRSFWASSLSFIIMGIVLMFAFFIILFSAIGSAFDAKPFSYEDKSVLHINIGEEISEKSFASFNKSSFAIDKAIGIREIKIALEAAKVDDKIKGIFLNMGDINAGMATLEEVRNAILDFKESKKFVVAYAESYTQKGYYLSTAADEVYLFHGGMVEFRGLGAELMFFKGMLDKLGVDMQIIRGSNNKFKSAVEPLMLDSMSDANREQTMTYINAMWDQMLTGISTTRGITISDLNTMADSVYVRNGKTSLEYKLVDGLKYEDEIMTMLSEKAGIGKDDELNLVDFSKYVYHQVKKSDEAITEDEKNIAVVYAVGGIESGKGDNTTIGSETIAKAIKDARLDVNIKAIVLRVNSPGGSALASDVIWREVILAKAVKPVIVSMGDLAASGGYYISCAADKIYAQPNTITGSIGVFGVIPNLGPMLKDKIGITTDRVSTNPHAVLSLTQALTEDEKKIIQEGVDDIYLDFTTKVAEGRGMTQPEVDSIGQGRVWSGTDALRLGLVDELGGIDAAIDYAAEKAGIKSSAVKIKTFPESKDEFMDLIMQFEMAESDDEEKTSIARQKIMDALNTVEQISSMQGVQARLPYEVIIR